MKILKLLVKLCLVYQCFCGSQIRKPTHYGSLIRNFLKYLSRADLNTSSVEEVTTSSVRLFHIGTALLCLTVKTGEKSFFSLDLKDSLQSLN